MTTLTTRDHYIHTERCTPVAAVGCRALAEDGLADAHDSRALLDRFFEIAGHAHGKPGHAKPLYWKAHVASASGCIPYHRSTIRTRRI